MGGTGGSRVGRGRIGPSSLWRNDDADQGAAVDQELPAGVERSAGPPATPGVEHSLPRADPGVSRIGSVGHHPRERDRARPAAAGRGMDRPVTEAPARSASPRRRPAGSSRPSGRVGSGRSPLDGPDEAGRGRPRAPRRAAGNRRRSRLRAFVDDYGWRAYAIPLLLAVTVVVVLQVVRSPAAAAPVGVPAGSGPAGSFVAGTAVDPRSAQSASDGSTTPGGPAGIGASPAGLPPLSGAPTAMPAAVPNSVAARAAVASAEPSSAAVVVASGAPSVAVPPPTGPPPPTVALTPTFSNLPSGVLPAGAAFVAAGRGHWHLVPGSTPPMGRGPIRLTYTVEVEDGVGNPQQDAEFAGTVDRILADPHSWIGSGRYTLQRIASGTPSFRVSLTSQLTERRPELCGWAIQLEASCYARDLTRVSINDARWTRGAMSFHGDLAGYRVYAINHEVGHALGYQHRPCPVDGGPAPVMMQQSWSTTDDDLAQLNPQLIPSDDKACRANPFPYPPGGGPAAAGPVPTGPLAPAVPVSPTPSR